MPRKTDDAAEAATISARASMRPRPDAAENFGGASAAAAAPPLQ